MIGLDTNVLIRFLTRDDPHHNVIARNFIAARSQQDPAFISLLVLAETCWVLRRIYCFSNAQIMTAVSGLLQAEDIEFEDRAFVGTLMGEGSLLRFDIADHIIAHIAVKNGCTHTVTFDRNAAKSVPGMELLA
jgi:predicted nucleic-acid-binding protein